MQVDKTITAGKSTLVLKPKTMSHLNRAGHETYMDVLSMLMSYRIAKRLILFTMKNLTELTKAYELEFTNCIKTYAKNGFFYGHPKFTKDYY